MKKIIYLWTLAIVIICYTASCNESQKDFITSKTFEVVDFSSLNLEIIGEVFYEQSDSFYMHVTGSSILIEALDISEKAGELSIQLKNKQRYANNKKQLVIRIGSPKLQAINSKSIGSFYINNYFKGDKLDIISKGIGKIMIDDCHVDNFSLTAKGIGKIEVKGTANDVVIESEGVGKIDCSAFKAKNATVVNKGTGSISAHAKEHINISITGIGNVTYYGNPADVVTNITGVGRAKSKD